MENTKKRFLGVHSRIKPYIHRTPVMTSHMINEMAGADILFKCENFQKMGAFKMRGAMNAVLMLPEEKRERGVVTHSSGNFAQALSLAARHAGIKAYIVMPANAPSVKKDAVRTYGGEIIECEPTQAAREEAARKVMEGKGAAFIHPYNDMDVIMGQGTAAMELLEDCPGLEYIISPVGGGGLVSGTILAAGAFGGGCRVTGAEPELMDDAFRSMRSGKIEGNRGPLSVADGLRTTLGDITFPIIREGIDRIVTVGEDGIIAAMRLLWERMKIVVEPSGAVPLAALLKEKDAFAGKKVGVILSGGNVDLDDLPFRTYRPQDDFRGK